MEAKIGVHQILHLQPPVDVTSNMQFKTKLANQRGVGAKNYKGKLPQQLLFIISEKRICVVPPSFLSGLYPEAQMYKHPVHAWLSIFWPLPVDGMSFRAEPL